ncbi:MAG: hypothetical protein WCX65_14845 [bacterium]
MATEKRILLIGGQTSFMNRLPDALEKAGFACDIIATGAGGIENVKHHEYAIAIIEDNPPDIYGAELCNSLKNESNNTSLKLVFVSETFDSTDSFKLMAEDVGIDLALNARCYPIDFVEHIVRLAEPVDMNEDGETDDDFFTDEIRAEYIAILFERFRMIETLLCVSQEKLKTSAGLADLRSCAHKINGSAGSYGYSSVSAEAAHLESFLDDIIESGETISKNKVIELHSYFDKIKINYQFDVLSMK